MSKRKILLHNYQSPGDIMMITSAVRDLYKAHSDKIEIGIDTSCKEIWENNPYINKEITKEDKDVEVIKADYSLIHQSNTSPYHFIHGFVKDLEEKLKLDIPITDFKGDIHISDDEQSWMSQIQEMGIDDDFWIVMAGCKYDYTAKLWHPDYYQEVIDHFVGKITFVQAGAKEHLHFPLENVIDLVGKTDMRQYIRLVYHSVGVLCPVTFGMHLAAGTPVKDGRPQNRACVVVAGGREPAQWEAYPHHRYLSTNGALMCCDNGGCWKSRCTKIKDNDKKNEDLCVLPIESHTKITYDDSQVDGGLYVPRCLDIIKPKDVIRAIEQYYEGGALRYGSSVSKIRDIKRKMEKERLEEKLAKEKAASKTEENKNIQKPSNQKEEVHQTTELKTQNGVKKVKSKQIKKKVNQ